MITPNLPTHNPKINIKNPIMPTTITPNERTNGYRTRCHRPELTRNKHIGYEKLGRIILNQLADALATLALFE
jgi:hypothetical protein